MRKNLSDKKLAPMLKEIKCQELAPIKSTFDFLHNTVLLKCLKSENHLKWISYVISLYDIFSKKKSTPLLNWLTE